MMKFSFQHRAFYCYLGMSIWIFFLVTVVYKYMAVKEATVALKVTQNNNVLKSDMKYRRLYLRACNPPENIVKGSEAMVDDETWLLQGVIVITRHGDRGPLTHLRDGDKLPCDTVPVSPLLKRGNAKALDDKRFYVGEPCFGTNGPARPEKYHVLTENRRETALALCFADYEEFVLNASANGRAWWVAGPGPFHNFPSLPRAAATRCALGQLTARGVLQMLTVGNILREAYGEKLGLEHMDLTGKRDTGGVSYSTRYRRTFQSLQALSWGVARAAAAAREAHSTAYCFRHCACPAHHNLDRKISSQTKSRLESHPAIKDLINRLSKVLFESQEYTDADIVRDALLAYMCHDIDLPCVRRQKSSKVALDKMKRFHEAIPNRNLLDVDIDTLNMELDYINNQLDFNNEIGRKARDIIGKYDKQKTPLDFDAQMEREKLLYYQQRYIDNADTYDDVVIVKKNLDADFNFPNDARDTDFDEDYKEPTPEVAEDFCIKKDHIMSVFAYLEWSYKQEVKNTHNRRRGLLIAYGLIHNIVQNMIRMISENKPKFVVYSGHDKTLQALILALGLNSYQHYNIQYAARIIFEVYRKKELRDEFKFTKRKAVAQDFFFRVVYNGEDVTNKLSFCRNKQMETMEMPVLDGSKVYKTYLCPIENIVRFIHDDYFTGFNVSNYKDACATYNVGKHIVK